MGTTWCYRRARHVAERVKAIAARCGPSLAAIGLALGAPTALLVPGHRRPGWRGCLGGPAPGHPERLVAQLPPSPVERVLWAQLDDTDCPTLQRSTR
ncbi:DUF6059 family protein [Streptomyces sp. NPDC086783]|uniref:DUF6059 family protein n=1 Tax=Streptomyces sp. NPDC086783 TaxID=3365758 RepID=UPI00380499D6